MLKTKIVCFANNKGGSGKSTTCSNTAFALSQTGKRILLIDADMQMNLSLSFFGEEEVLSFSEGEGNLFQVMKEGLPLSGAVTKTSYPGLDLLPSSFQMSGIEEMLFSAHKGNELLKKALEKVRTEGNYHYIFIDAPPTLGLWVRNILSASDYIVIPVEASPWGLFGLANMMSFVEEVQKDAENLKVAGILLTRVDVRKNYYRETKDMLEEMGDIRVFDGCIRLDSAIEWAQDNSMPVGAYKRSSRSAAEYRYFAEQLDKALNQKGRRN